MSASEDRRIDECCRSLRESSASFAERTATLVAAWSASMNRLHVRRVAGLGGRGRLPRGLAAVRVPSHVSGRGKGARPGQARGRSAGLPPPARSDATRRAAGRRPMPRAASTCGPITTATERRQASTPSQSIGPTRATRRPLSRSNCPAIGWASDLWTPRVLRCGPRSPPVPPPSLRLRSSKLEKRTVRIGRR